LNGVRIGGILVKRFNLDKVGRVVEEREEGGRFPRESGEDLLY
jgi:hypothetical protein